VHSDPPGFPLDIVDGNVSESSKPDPLLEDLPLRLVSLPPLFILQYARAVCLVWGQAPPAIHRAKLDSPFVPQASRATTDLACR
jgi:hypothetical protein